MQGASTGAGMGNAFLSQIRGVQVPCTLHVTAAASGTHVTRSDGVSVVRPARGRALRGLSEIIDARAGGLPCGSLLQ